MLLKTNQRPFNTKKMNLANQPFFAEFLIFLISKKNEIITLKDLKKKFPEIESINTFIDELIEFNIIKRHHGKYSYTGVFISKEQQITINHATRNELLSQKAVIIDLFNYLKKDTTNDIFCLMLLLKLFSDDDLDPIAIYENTPLSRDLLSLPTRLSQVNGKQLSIISFDSHLSRYGNNIGDYFDFLTLNQENLPESYTTIYNLVGDVNKTYFVHQIERHLRRLEKGKHLSKQKANIVMDTLLFMNYIEQDDEDYYLKAIRVKKQADWTALDDMLTGIESKVSLLEDVSSYQKSFMVRSIILSWLINTQIITLPKCLNGMI